MEFRSGFVPIFIAITAVLIALLVSGGVFYYTTANKHSSGSVACTMEAKQCPDGSYVGRTGPSCEFAACPAAQNSGTSPVDTSGSSTALTAGWKTYTNAQYGFSFKYPPGHSVGALPKDRIADWSVNPSYKYGASLDNFNHNYYNGGFMPEGGAVFYAFVTTLSVENLLSARNIEFVLSTSTIVIAGDIGLREDGATIVGRDTELNEISAFLSHRGYTYVISLESYNYADPSQLFNAILSTFKFTSSASQLTVGQVLNGYDQCGNQFKNGTIEQSMTADQLARANCPPYTHLWKNQIVFADLDGDGILEVLVPANVVWASSGGEIEVFKNVSGTAKIIDTLATGKDNDPKIISINKGTLVVEYLDMGFDPSVKIREIFQFTNGHFVQNASSK